MSAAIAIMLELEHPIYAFIAAIIVTDLSPAESQRAALRRIAATVIGAVCGALLTYVSPTTWALAAGVFVSMMVCFLMRLDQGAKIAGYVCGIVLFDHGAEPWTYAYLRFIETVLGVAVGVVISFVPKLIRPPKTTPV